MLSETETAGLSTETKERLVEAREAEQDTQQAVVNGKHQIAEIQRRIESAEHKVSELESKRRETLSDVSGGLIDEPNLVKMRKTLTAAKDHVVDLHEIRDTMQAAFRDAEKTAAAAKDERARRERKAW